MSRKTFFTVILSLFVSTIILCTKVNLDELPTTPVVEDIIAPIITIHGEKVDTVVLNVESYLLPEITAYDSTDGDLTDSIIIAGSIDSTVVGENFIYLEVVLVQRES